MRRSRLAAFAFLLCTGIVTCTFAQGVRIERPRIAALEGVLFAWIAGLFNESLSDDPSQYYYMFLAWTMHFGKFVGLEVPGTAATSNHLKAATAAPVDGALIAMPLTKPKGCATSKAGAIHPNQRFFYTATDAGAFGNVCGFVFDQDTKAFTAIPGSPYRAGGGTRSVAIDPSGTFLYAANLDDGTVSAFSINPATGALTAIAGSPFVSGPAPISVVVEPSGRFVYVTNNTTNQPVGSVSGFAIDQETGALNRLPGSPYPAPMNPGPMAADPLGRYIFVAANSIQAYAIDPQSGVLTANGAPVEPFGKGIAADPTGRFVYVTSNSPDRLIPYAVGPSGRLTPIGQAMPTGTNPLGVAVDVSGRFVYVANLFSDDASGFAIDQVTGALAPLPGFPQPMGPRLYAFVAGGILPARAAWPVGLPFFYPLGVSGGYPPYTWSLASGTLPPGLSMRPAYGGLQGTPVTPGTFSFIARVVDSRGSAATKSYEFNVLSNAAAATPAVYEFYNAALDNFFVTSSLEEAVAIDIGNAGPGWHRTGRPFGAGGSSQVCRFYGSISPGPNSHFYSIDPGECQQLKTLQATTPATQKRWNFESLDFASTPAVNGNCAAGLVPVYRAYNNGFARGVDSNHRITASLAAIDEVVGNGWINEGVVMCAPAR